MTQATEAETGRISTAAAEVYDREFVPALFGPFAALFVEAMGLTAGARILDLACGTGAVALAAERRRGTGAGITAVDINPAMLAVARRKSREIAWREAAAEALPFADGSFDAVLCQFALMFLADRTTALREMARVTRPGGRIGFTVFETVANSPAYDRLVPLIDEIAGQEAAAALAVPFRLGDPAAIAAELEAATLAAAEVRPVAVTVRHPSLDAWIDTEIGGWTLAGMVSAGQLERIKRAAREALAAHVGADGRVAFAARAWLVIIRP